MVPLLFVILNTIDFGEVKEPVFKKPNALSVDEAVTPLTQFIVPPPDVPVTAPVPVDP